MVEPADLVGEEPPAVGQDDPQPGVPLEDAAEEKAGGGHRGLEREADHVPQMVGLEPAQVAEVLRVQEKRNIEPLRHPEQRLEAKVIEVLAVDV